LSDPVGTFELFPSFVEILGISDIQQREKCSQMLLFLLPTEHVHFLKQLSSLFHALAKDESIAQNLGNIFGPLIFKTKETSVSVNAFKQQKDLNMLVKRIIEKGEDAFDFAPITKEFQVELAKIKRRQNTIW